MRYINLTEELTNEDAHVLASRLASMLHAVPWWDRGRLNLTAVASFVEDLAERVDVLNREELYTLMHGASDVHDLEAYQAAHVRLYGCEDAYVEYDWSHEW